MCRILTLLLVLICSRGVCDDDIIESPRKTFKIVQQYREPQGQDSGGHHKQTLQFSDGAGIVLEEGSTWRASYEVSPDERWILRIQKSGSGENISYLYRIDEHRRIWRLEEQIGEFAFAFLAKTSDVVFEDLYHTGIEFQSWDLTAGLLNFVAHGTSARESGKGVKRALAYRLAEHTIISPK